MAHAPQLLTPEALADELPALAGLLHACVEAGASVNFVLPFGYDEARAYWQDKVLGPASAGTRCVWAARLAGRTVGTVQLDLDTPPNGRHRGEVTKLLVHPDARRRGIASALMDALESHAARLGRTLLTLDTRSDDAAEPLYAARGYTRVGTIPGYCRDPFDRGLDPTTIMYKQLCA
jgi:ribosomal protein S18 acetylase RimI-like enzyme